LMSDQFQSSFDLFWLWPDLAFETRMKPVTSRPFLFSFYFQQNVPVYFMDNSRGTRVAAIAHVLLRN
jgi:hypothetical protein